jgi:hypothetical protein
MGIFGPHMMHQIQQLDRFMHDSGTIIAGTGEKINYVDDLSIQVAQVPHPTRPLMLPPAGMIMTSTLNRMNWKFVGQTQASQVALTQKVPPTIPISRIAQLCPQTTQQMSSMITMQRPRSRDL